MLHNAGDIACSVCATPARGAVGVGSRLKWLTHFPFNLLMSRDDKLAATILSGGDHIQ